MANNPHASTVIGSNDKRAHVTLDHEWPFPRKNTEKIGANNAAQHHGTTTMAESVQILREKQIYFFRGNDPALKSCYRVSFKKIFTSIRSFGERPIQTNHIQLAIYVRFKLPESRTGHESRVIG